jgi:UDP-galactopyranose mutase
VVNYPNNYDWTRIVEFKHFLKEDSKNTIVLYEYPEQFECNKNERYYPIVSEDNNKLYENYLAEAKKLKNVYFFGRMGDYKYYDMDKAVDRALQLFKNL